MCFDLSATDVLAAVGGLSLIGAGFGGVVGGAIYLWDRRASRARWWEACDGVLPASPSDGPFRPAGVVPASLKDAPAALRRAAYLSMATGIATLALLPVCVFTLLFGVGVILLLPLVAGVNLAWAGRRVLLRDPGAYHHALDAARLATVFGFLFGALVGLAGLLSPVFFSLSLPWLVFSAHAGHFGQVVERHRHVLEV
jgi:hypothetical protein